MNRAIVLALLAAVAAPALMAQTAPPESDDARYTFTRVDDGYLRLDGRTGQVSLCVRRAIGWTCQTVPDERVALEAEIARLQAENAALKKELLSRNLPLPSVVKPEQPADKKGNPRLRLPTSSDFYLVASFIGRVWRRLVDMIVAVQNDILGRT
jgi:hypothetical protein